MVIREMIALYKREIKSSTLFYNTGNRETEPRAKLTFFNWVYRVSKYTENYEVFLKHAGNRETIPLHDCKVLATTPKKHFRNLQKEAVATTRAPSQALQYARPLNQRQKQAYHAARSH